MPVPHQDAVEERIPRQCAREELGTSQVVRQDTSPKLAKILALPQHVKKWFPDIPGTTIEERRPTLVEIFPGRE